MRRLDKIQKDFNKKVEEQRVLKERYVEGEHCPKCYSELDYENQLDTNGYTTTRYCPSCDHIEYSEKVYFNNHVSECESSVAEVDKSCKLEMAEMDYGDIGDLVMNNIMEVMKPNRYRHRSAFPHQDMILE